MRSLAPTLGSPLSASRLLFALSAGYPGTVHWPTSRWTGRCTTTRSGMQSRNASPGHRRPGLTTSRSTRASAPDQLHPSRRRVGDTTGRLNASKRRPGRRAGPQADPRLDCDDAVDLASRVRTEDAGSSGRCWLLGRRGELARVRKVAAVLTSKNVRDSPTSRRDLYVADATNGSRLRHVSHPHSHPLRLLEEREGQQTSRPGRGSNAGIRQ